MNETEKAAMERERMNFERRRPGNSGRVSESARSHDQSTSLSSLSSSGVFEGVSGGACLYGHANHLLYLPYIYNPLWANFLYTFGYWQGRQS